MIGELSFFLMLQITQSKKGIFISQYKHLRETLKKFGMDSTDAIAQLIKNGQYAMPAYKGRLTDSQIIDVSAYVLEQAKRGWK